MPLGAETSLSAARGGDVPHGAETSHTGAIPHPRLHKAARSPSQAQAKQTRAARGGDLPLGAHT
eukprot:8033357-Heterocapsa_arctica.AAC.1